ncbi:AarF domain kinase [Cucumis melo var. makuwa]|uniref:AarF domain kinase n=1 Tax=Cucumis melo var. makuwa TaxID=1194695 RepID=A0A5A7SUU8_CUCMM|nr:AarF domain kinase [Cucumis melo var. makuwa]TYK09283.1 AarF domain kinase [Cucumis melo var. makuwa]
MAAMAMAMAPSSSFCQPLPAATYGQARKLTLLNRRRPQVLANWGHFADVVRKDVEFIKVGLGRGIRWANDAFRIPQVSKSVDDVLWLRNIEDPQAVNLPTPSQPQPSYPELSGVDLFMADLKALEAYAVYYYSLSKVWTKPLPEVYDPQSVAEYFRCRPHIVGLRLLEVFSSFASASIRIRMSRVQKFPGTSLYEDSDESKSKFGLVLKETLLNLGPTFIKVGQSISTRPDIIGSEISKALSELHDQIPPFPRTIAMKIIQEELGSPVESFFSYISEEPVAAASFGQVYRGRTLDGINVAVKVQRPNMLHVVARDVYILRLGLGFLQKMAKRKNDLRLYADELGKGLLGELDYNLEARNATEFMETHSRFPFIQVPKVFRHLSRKRVLTMEWISGDSPTELLTISSGKPSSAYSERQIADARRRLLDLVNKGVEATLVQLLDTGLLHADPHPGNLRYIPSGQIGFLDFGLLCRMEEKHQLAMLASIVHIVNGEWASLVEALADMDVVRPGTNMRRVTLDLEYALGEVEFQAGIPDVKFSKVLGKIWSVALKYHFRMPPYYTLMLRSLASLEGLALAADKDFKTFEAAFPYVVQKLLTENSVATRKILHSVVLNKKKEFQWQRVVLFLRIGAMRKSLQRMLAPHNEAAIELSAVKANNQAAIAYSTVKANSDLELVNLITRLLVSKEGVVLRRLIMTVNGASLIQAMVSKEAKFFRQQLCTIVADIIHQWVLKTLGQGSRATELGTTVRMGIPSDKKGRSSPQLTATGQIDYISFVNDRRMRLLFSKVLKSASTKPTLMLKFFWTSFVIFATASAMACHRIVVSLSEAYLGPISLSPKQYAVYCIPSKAITAELYILY